MRLLLDTHGLIWWWGRDPQLSEIARDAIGDPGNTVFVSAVTAYEIGLKVALGRLPAMKTHLGEFDLGVCGEGFHHLELEYRHSLRAASLPLSVRDPFDRFLAAQALHETLVVVTRDPAFAAFGCKVLW